MLNSFAHRDCTGACRKIGFHFLLFFLTASAASAQQPAASGGTATSREESISQAQAEKSRNLHPYVPTRAERIIQRALGGVLAPPSGFYPAFGSVFPGGGLGLGPGYRRLFGDRSVFNVSAMYSLKSYKTVEASVISAGRARGRLTFDARAGWLDATQVAYYGLGMETVPEDRANFRFKETYAGAGFELRPVRWAVFGGNLAFEDYQLESGLGKSPSIEELFTPVTAPGLGTSPSYLHSQVTAGIDWRTSPGYSRTGGYYGATLHDYEDRDDDQTFRRLNADVIQHIPILRETWVLSFRGSVNTILNDDDEVPYFLLPSLGSGSTLRAYPSWRFRDRHSLLTSAELRWIPNRLALDMALFVDAGKVGARRQDLDFDNLKRNVGIGIRFHSPTQTVLRVEATTGDEGWHLVFASRAAF